MLKLRKKYSLSKKEDVLCSFVRRFSKSNKVPKVINKLSKRWYGWSNNLERYYLEKYFDVSIGKYSYGYNNIGISFIKSIGSFCSIANGSVAVHGNHHMEFITTSPILTTDECGFTNKYNELDYFHTIEIGNDVWIGAGCLIFPFVKIGDGAVIAAGSIVRKDVPPYAVIGGVDRLIKYRFPKHTIDKLLTIKWWEWDDKKIKANIQFMYDVNVFVEKFYL